MRNVGVFIFPDVEVLDFAGPFEVFGCSADALGRQEFNVFTIGVDASPIRAIGGLHVQPDYTLDTHPDLDILVVPGGNGRRQMMQHPAVLEWVQAQAPRVEALLSVCTGAFILGNAGLLNGLAATTHHECWAEFAQTFPDVYLRRNVFFVDNGKIITAAGISAGIVAALHLLERLLGEIPRWQVQQYMEFVLPPTPIQFHDPSVSPPK